MEKLRFINEDDNLNKESYSTSNETVDTNDKMDSKSINEEIDDRQKIINNTLDRINKIRQELGLSLNVEMPPSVQQIKESIDKLSSKIEYFQKIPIEKGKYYRVTGISELRSIVKNRSLITPDQSYYDRSILNQIAKNSNYSIDELESINYEDPKKIRDIYNQHVLEPNREGGKIRIVARTKSNHGDIGFVKEGFFYDPMDKKSGHFGAPVIVGSEDKSVFEAGSHGTHKGVFNEEVEPTKAVVLKSGIDATNFEYWTYDENNGWNKNSFDDLKIKFEDKNNKL